MPQGEDVQLVDQMQKHRLAGDAKPVAEAREHVHDGDDDVERHFERDLESRLRRVVSMVAEFREAEDELGGLGQARGVHADTLEAPLRDTNPFTEIVVPVERQSPARARQADGGSERGHLPVCQHRFGSRNQALLRQQIKVN